MDSKTLKKKSYEQLKKIAKIHNITTSAPKTELINIIETEVSSRLLNLNILPNSNETQFTITSNVVVWGQIDTVLEGLLSTCLNKMEPLPGGTIYQADHCYRTLVKPGLWNRCEITIFDNDNDYDNVYVVFYNTEIKDIKEFVINSVKDIDFSWEPTNLDKGFFVNRYDWGYHHSGLYSHFKGDPTSFILVDEKWGKKLPINASKILEKLNDEELEDLHTQSNNEIFKLLSVKNTDFKQINKDVSIISGMGIQDKTFIDADWLYGRIIFNKNKEMIAFIINQ